MVSHTNRPIVDLTLAANYGFGGAGVFGFHVVNFVIHVLAAFVLMLIVQSTLRTQKLSARYGERSHLLATACALLWLVHPLQIESVTYIIQRAESLMGLFYFLSLYSVIRAQQSGRTIFWGMAAVVFCVLGTGSKEVMSTVVIVIFIYDRIFLSASFKEIMRNRGWIYVGMALTWGWMYVLVTTPRPGEVSAGFHLKTVTPVAYTLSQFGVICHYLRLAVWPTGLCLDYGWPAVKNFVEVLFPLSGVMILLILTGWALRFYPAAGFLGLWFFIILSPTSSFIPIADLAVEHRMYLPLAAVCVLTCFTLDYFISHFKGGRYFRGAFVVSVAVVALLLTGATIMRNHDYRSPVAIWQDTVNKRPQNGRAYFNLGIAYLEQKQFETARECFRKGFVLEPNYAKAYYNYGLIFIQQGLYEQAVEPLENALKIDPGYAQAHINLGLALVETGRIEEGIEHYRKAMDIKSDDPIVFNNIGAALIKQKKYEQALPPLKKALEMNPAYAQAYVNLGQVYFYLGELPEARGNFDTAVRLKPADANAHFNLGQTLAMLDEFDAAAVQFELALKLRPDFAGAKRSLDLVRAIKDK